jgi:hypothetical protein
VLAWQAERIFSAKSKKDNWFLVVEGWISMETSLLFSLGKTERSKGDEGSLEKSFEKNGEKKASETHIYML